MPPVPADIPQEQAAPTDDWARALLPQLLAEPDLYALAIQMRAVVAASTDAQRLRLQAAMRALGDLRRWGVPPEDQALWVGAALSEDPGLRDRALLGAWFGARRRPEGDLAVPAVEAVTDWMEQRAELVDLTWSLHTHADEAEWRSDGAPDSELREPMRVRTWTVRVGARLEDSGEALATRLGLRADCRDRVVGWETVQHTGVVTYDPGARGSGLGYGSTSVRISRSDEIPERPDQCLRRSRVEAAVVSYNQALQEELGLAGFQLPGAQEPPPAAPRVGPATAPLDPSVFDD